MGGVSSFKSTSRAEAEAERVASSSISSSTTVALSAGRLSLNKRDAERKRPRWIGQVTPSSPPTLTVIIESKSDLSYR